MTPTPPRSPRSGRAQGRLRPLLPHRRPPPTSPSPSPSSTIPPSSRRSPPSPAAAPCSTIETHAIGPTEGQQTLVYLHVTPHRDPRRLSTTSSTTPPSRRPQPSPRLLPRHLKGTSTTIPALRRVDRAGTTARLMAAAATTAQGGSWLQGSMVHGPRFAPRSRRSRRRRWGGELSEGRDGRLRGQQQPAGGGPDDVGAGEVREGSRRVERVPCARARILTWGWGGDRIDEVDERCGSCEARGFRWSAEGGSSSQTGRATEELCSIRDGTVELT